jgi:hypothetical protein
VNLPAGRVPDEPAPLTPLAASTDGAWEAVLAQAWEAFRARSTPIGAVIVGPTGGVVAVGRDRRYEPAAPAGQLTNSHIAHALKHSGPLQDIGSNHPFCPLSRMLSCSFQPRADRSPCPAQPWLAPPVTRPRVRPALCRSRRAPRRPPPAGAGRAPLWCGSGCPRQVPAARTCDRPVRRTRAPTGSMSP